MSTGRKKVGFPKDTGLLLKKKKKPQNLGVRVREGRLKELSMNPLILWCLKSTEDETA